jgi:hypothetical protein
MPEEPVALWLLVPGMPLEVVWWVSWGKLPGMLLEVLCELVPGRPLEVW